MRPEKCSALAQPGSSAMDPEALAKSPGQGLQATSEETLPV